MIERLRMFRLASWSILDLIKEKRDKRGERCILGNDLFQLRQFVHYWDRLSEDRKY